VFFPAKCRQCIKSASTVVRKLLHKADRGRWMNAHSFCLEWEERARTIARFVPKGSRVIEFGAGLRRLQGYLDLSCTYVASDLTNRGQDTLILDLERRPLPKLLDEQFDVAIFAGVLEYVSDVPGVVSWICQYVTTCILSYECAPRSAHVYGRLKQAWDRAALGWVNAHTEEDIKRLFTTAGFVCVLKTLWGAPEDSEPIFVFRRAPPTSRGRAKAGPRWHYGRRTMPFR
jgi:hypothetical protein